MSTNREIFDTIAESWYRLRHWCRFTDELAEVSRKWQGGKLLNVGCAHGPDFLPFKDNFELYGVDFSVQMLKMAQQYAAKFQFNVNLAAADANQLPFSSGVFDCAIAIATYHHISDEEKRQDALRELRRVLKPGAEAFITVWNKWQPGFLFKSKDALVAWKTKERTLYRYYYLYSYPELERDLIKSGFKIINIAPEKSFKFPLKVFSQNICALVKVN